MIYIEAPSNYTGNEKSLFLAGGISDCPDWQQELVTLLHHENIVIYNPRRKEMTVDNPDISEEQITWEHNHLKKADAISFWFPMETLNPIVLYELGAWSMTDKTLFIGVHPEYKRKQDIEIQTRLVRPDVEIVYDIQYLHGQIVDWLRK